VELHFGARWRFPGNVPACIEPRFCISDGGVPIAGRAREAGTSAVSKGLLGGGVHELPLWVGTAIDRHCFPAARTATVLRAAADNGRVLPKRIPRKCLAWAWTCLPGSDTGFAGEAMQAMPRIHDRRPGE